MNIYVHDDDDDDIKYDVLTCIVDILRVAMKHGILLTFNAKKWVKVLQ
jgi:hypothetical protein